MLRDVSRSSLFMTTVSNRLGASITQARFLGMVLGAAVSKLTDKPDKMLDFDADEMGTAEARSWLAIPNIFDTVGNLDDLRAVRTSQAVSTTTPSPSKGRDDMRLTTIAPKPLFKPISTARPKIQLLESEDEDDLVPYPKPDDDPSDSEDDATLIDRSKPSAPVYILDLVKGLQTTDKPELVQLMLKTAPSLIRRKTNFGTELSDHLQELSAALINLREDTLEENTTPSRLESLIACFVASPIRMGPWATKIYFNGDLSVSQRACLLSTIGLGVRELAGHTDDPKLGQSPVFASERLPGRLEAIYEPIGTIARQLEVPRSSQWHWKQPTNSADQTR